MIEGLFIALEGVDGAGTTTQAELLARALRARGLPVHTTREPSDGPVGLLLRQILTGRVVVPGIHGARPPTWTTMALLFAADRLDHLEAEVHPNLMDGVTVVTDRYYHSSVAYQSVSAGGGASTIGWVREINRQARVPDLTIVLDVRPEVAADRRRARARTRELFEDEALQQELVVFYDTIEAHFPGEKIVHIDANVGVDEVAAEIMRLVRELRGEA